jgi:Tfp pilus assembly protein PilF
MFRAAVRADPKDATAMSQLALLYSEGDPAAAESRLRNLIASQPAAGAPYYALGSLLARQQRWSEAQQALFQAYTLDSDNPDVLFNLAVCLEHLGQPAVARQFYERSLQAAVRRPAGFDRSAALGRVQALGNR